MATQGQQWAAALHRAKHHSRRRSEVSFDERRATLLERLDMKKQHILDAVAQKDEKKCEQLIQKFLDIRAELVRVSLDEYHDQFGVIPRPVTERELANYAHDYEMLIKNIATIWSLA